MGGARRTLGIREEVKAVARHRYMNAKEACEHWGIGKTTLREYAARGLIGTWQPLGANAAIRYYDPEEDIDTADLAMLQVIKAALEPASLALRALEAMNGQNPEYTRRLEP